MLGKGESAALTSDDLRQWFLVITTGWTIEYIESLSPDKYLVYCSLAEMYCRSTAPALMAGRGML